MRRWAFERCLNHEAGAFMKGIVKGHCLIKGLQREVPRTFHHIRTQTVNQKEGAYPPVPALALDFPASRTMRNKYFVFINDPVYSILL